MYTNKVLGITIVSCISRCPHFREEGREGGREES